MFYQLGVFDKKIEKVEPPLRQIAKIIVYNENGEVHYPFNYNEKGELTISDPSGVNYKYNEKGQLLYRTFGDVTDENKIKENGESAIYKYDENGNVIEFFFREGSSFTCYYEYENGLLVKETDENEYDLVNQTEYSYDSKGRLVTKNKFVISDVSPDFDEDDWTTYEYDDAGNLIYIKEDITRDGIIDSLVRYIYDENSVKREIDDDNDGSVDKVTISEYNQDGKEIKRSIDSNNDGNAEEVHEFDYKLFEVKWSTHPNKEKEQSVTLYLRNNVNDELFNEQEYFEFDLSFENSKLAVDEYGYIQKVVSADNEEKVLCEIIYK